MQTLTPQEKVPFHILNLDEFSYHLDLLGTSYLPSSSSVREFTTEKIVSKEQDLKKNIAELELESHSMTSQEAIFGVACRMILTKAATF